MIELAVVVPTFKERENVMPLLDLLSAALQGIEYEVIFVDDDSPDGTADLVRKISLLNPLVRIVHRVNRRGLSSACVEGMLASAAPYVCVMDADIQHDERIIPAMLRKLKDESLDVVVGSRNVEGGSMGNFAPGRVFLSTLGRRFSTRICGCDISDPMSGFFILTRSFLMEVVHRISGIGFKILVDLLASSQRPVQMAEVPYQFRTRERGESKLDILVGIEYLQLLLDKVIGEYIPSSFVLFTLVGCVGVILHLATLGIELFWFDRAFRQSQAIAAFVAMVANFLLNNLITYRDRRLRGWHILEGLLFFCGACSIGLIINLTLADYARNAGAAWYIAGLLGLAVGSVWNYGVTGVLTWRTGQDAKRRKKYRVQIPASVAGLNEDLG